MVKSGTVYPLKALRALTLHSQGLTAPVGAEPGSTPDRLYDTIKQLGCVQIDSIQMVQRSQYLVLLPYLVQLAPGDSRLTCLALLRL